MYVHILYVTYEGPCMPDICSDALSQMKFCHIMHEPLNVKEIMCISFVMKCNG